jgi:beta-1,4-mannosyl-glycoprotein beta-1,4-N-acetylglucosaminyltransferase
MKIIDAFTFFNEIDVLKIRLSLLYEKVDTFVICESNVTHSGKTKQYNFLEHKNEFMPWMDKITFLQYEPDISELNFSQKDSEYNPSSAPWQIEISQRNFLSSILITQNPADVAIISDIDEIWNPSFFDFIRSGKISYEAARLEMQFHSYYLNCVGVGRANSKWTHPYFAKIGYINSNKNLSKIRLEARLPEIGNAGWHFSYLGGAEKVSDKINAFAHQETNTAEINNLIHLKRCINLGIDHLSRPDHEWAFRPIDCYPEVIRNEMKKYPHLIKSSLI